MQPTIVGNLNIPTYAQEGVQKQEKTPYIPPDRVATIPSSTSNLSVRREETPMRKKANIRVKSAELSEESDRVEELLNSAKELLNTLSTVKDDKKDENLSVESEKIIRQLQDISQKLASEGEQATEPDPALRQETRPEPAQAEMATKEEKVIFETSAESDEMEKRAFYEVNFEAREVRFQSEEAERVPEKNEVKAANRRDAAEAEQSESAREAGRDEQLTRQVERQGKREGETTPDEKVLGELIEEIRQKLIMKSNRRDEAYQAAVSNRQQRQAEAESDRAAEVTFEAEDQLVAERQNLERIKERTNSSVRELVTELSREPAEAESGDSYNELNSLLDKTLRDIQENRASLKELKGRHEEIEQTQDLSGPSREVPAIDQRQAERIASELTREPPVNQLKRVQQRITPDAVSQLLF